MDEQLKEAFERIRVLEVDVATQRANQSNHYGLLGELKRVFERHDENEMKKYDEITKSLNALRGTVNRLVGGLLVVQVVIMPVMEKWLG